MSLGNRPIDRRDTKYYAIRWLPRLRPIKMELTALLLAKYLWEKSRNYTKIVYCFWPAAATPTGRMCNKQAIIPLIHYHIFVGSANRKIYTKKDTM